MPDEGVCNDLCSNSATDQELSPLTQPPQKPSKPVAEHDRGIYVMVKWTQPEDVGEADITGYVIKYRSVNYNDEDTDYPILSVAGKTTSFQFTDQLKENKYYRFAVAAVNRGGQGEFSEFSDVVVTCGGK